MKIIPPSFMVLTEIHPKEMLRALETYGRVCYKSESKSTDESASRFIGRLIKSGHESVIEHEKITVKFVCDRGVSHEIVRHRIASYSQESTRYCNYAKDKFGNELTFVKPCFWNEESEEYSVWLAQMESAEKSYFKLINSGAKPEQARGVLPNSLKTEIVVTMNLRSWRHFFKLRTAADAHPQIREISIPLLEELKGLLPEVFGDL